jgi:uncharacterized protein (TIGR02598 family)
MHLRDIRTKGRDRCTNSDGFSFIETLIAVGILTTGLLTLAQLFSVAAANTRISRNTSMAAALAQQKIEQLRGQSWDTFVASPPGSLEGNLDGWVDYIDLQGRTLGSGSAPRPGTTFVRRWLVAPLPAAPGDAWTFHVLVTPFIERRTGQIARTPGEVRLAALRIRR